MKLAPLLFDSTYRFHASINTILFGFVQGGLEQKKKKSGSGSRSNVVRWEDQGQFAMMMLVSTVEMTDLRDRGVLLTVRRLVPRYAGVVFMLLAFAAERLGCDSEEKDGRTLVCLSGVPNYYHARTQRQYWRFSEHMTASEAEAELRSSQVKA